jgi:hypothetical protein
LRDFSINEEKTSKDDDFPCINNKKKRKNNKLLVILLVWVFGKEDLPITGDNHKECNILTYFHCAG